MSSQFQHLPQQPYANGPTAFARAPAGFHPRPAAPQLSATAPPAAPSPLGPLAGPVGMVAGPAGMVAGPAGMMAGPAGMGSLGPAGMGSVGPGGGTSSAPLCAPMQKMTLSSSPAHIPAAHPAYSTGPVVSSAGVGGPNAVGAPLAGPTQSAPAPMSAPAPLPTFLTQRPIVQTSVQSSERVVSASPASSTSMLQPIEEQHPPVQPPPEASNPPMSSASQETCSAGPPAGPPANTMAPIYQHHVQPSVPPNPVTPSVPMTYSPSATPPIGAPTSAPALAPISMGYQSGNPADPGPLQSAQPPLAAGVRPPLGAIRPPLATGMPPATQINRPTMMTSTAGAAVAMPRQQFAAAPPGTFPPQYGGSVSSAQRAPWMGRPPVEHAPTAGYNGAPLGAVAAHPPTTGMGPMPVAGGGPIGGPMPGPRLVGAGPAIAAAGHGLAPMPSSTGPTPAYPGVTGAPPQQPRRATLDPDQIPNPVQVWELDKQSHSGAYLTGERGQVPPLVTTSFFAQDQGNCNPRFVRSTLYNVPSSNDMLKESQLSFALTICPFARLHPQEVAPPIVNFGETGPVRCHRCKAYMCPYMQFTDGGRRFECAFCGCHNDVEQQYFCHLDHTGSRTDTYERPELYLGSYELVATEAYCRDNKLPQPPVYVFMIDVSYNAVKSGMVSLLCSRLKRDILSQLPHDADDATGQGQSPIRVAFVTYDRTLHFYNIKPDLTMPQMMVVSDVNDVFAPLLDGFYSTVDESEPLIDSLLEQIPTMFAETRETEVMLGPVVEAGLDLMKSGGLCGKLFVFHSNLPTLEAPGQLKTRDDRKVVGTDREKTMLQSQNAYYGSLGQKCVENGCAVDLFLFPNAYIDIATLGELCRLTGGNLYKYNYFQADLEGELFLEDLRVAVSRQCGYDVVMRVRTSSGIRPTDFYGNFHMDNSTDMQLGCTDSDRAVCCEVKHDDKLSDRHDAYVQVAVLFTSVGGQRRLRIHNLALQCTSALGDMYKSCELDVLMNFLCKRAIRASFQTSAKQVAENLIARCAQILAAYRKNCAHASSPGQLILPEGMKLLPLLANCVLKCDAIHSCTDCTFDDRSYLMLYLNASTVPQSNLLLYPRCYNVFELGENGELGQPMRCSTERLKSDSVYVVHNGVIMFLWVGSAVPVAWIQDVFAVNSAVMIDCDKVHKLQNLDNGNSQKLRAAVASLRQQCARYMKLIVVRQTDKSELWFQRFMVEDQTPNTMSYVDFLCHIHKEIRSLLN